MKTRHLFHGAALALSVCAAAIAAEPADVRLTISTEAAGPRIEPEVYGHFVEHLGTGVYGGLWVGPESKIPNTRGWRNDVVEALRRIEVPVIRWPGGCFADDYDWRDGIGDPAKRPVRLNRWWGGVPETNRVGTHEFMDLVEMLGGEAYIAANMGSMSPRDASQWLEYMTSDSKSSLAEERRRNGRDRPWKVKYVGVGNESWGCGGNMRPEYQADLHNRYATYLQGTLRVASGDGQQNDHLVEVLMERSGTHMDAFTLHYYTTAGEWEDKGPATGFGADRWAKGLQSALGIEKRIVAVSSIMDKHDPKRRVAPAAAEHAARCTGRRGHVQRVPPPYRAGEDGQHRADGQRVAGHGADGRAAHGAHADLSRVRPLQAVPRRGPAEGDPRNPALA